MNDHLLQKSITEAKRCHRYGKMSTFVPKKKKGAIEKGEKMYGDLVKKKYDGKREKIM